MRARCEVESFEKWRQFVAEPRNSPEAMEAVTGVPAAEVRAAARLYAHGRQRRDLLRSGRDRAQPGIDHGDGHRQSGHGHRQHRSRRRGRQSIARPDSGVSTAMKSIGTMRRTLMQHLEERVLAVRARLAPDHGGGRVIDHRAVEPRRLAVALHFELLQIRRTGNAALPNTARPDTLCEPKKLRYQMPIMPSSTGRLRSSGASRKCWSISCAPASSSSNFFGPTDDHDRQTDRRPQRIAAADPVPHLEDVFFRDAELDHFRRIRRYADKVLRQRVFRAAFLHEPVAHASARWSSFRAS